MNTEKLVKSVNTHTQNIIDLNSSLETINKHNTLFNPIFGTDLNMYKGVTPRPESELITYLTKLYKNGAKKLIVVVSIGMYGETNVTLLQDKAFIRKYVELAKNIGFEIDTLKIHWKDNTMNTIVPTLSDSDLQNKYLTPYTTITTDLMDSFKDLFSSVVVLNECSVFYRTDTSYFDFTNNLLMLGKTKGYKVGISTMGATENLNMNSTIQASVDRFYINIYPFMSYKLDSTQLTDCVEGWNNSYELRTIKTLKTYFPGKSIIITETGCLDYYESLSAPGVWNMSGFTPTNGKASSLMVESMFISELQNYVKEVYWCYWETIYFDEVGKLINYYTNGGVKNV